MQCHGSLETFLYWNNKNILVSVVLPCYLFTPGYIITHDTTSFIMLPLTFLKIITVLCWWWPRMEVLPGVCRKFWTIISCMVTLNFHSEFYAINIEQHLFQPCLLLYSIITAFPDCDLFQCWPHPYLPYTATNREYMWGIHGYSKRSDAICAGLIWHDLRLTWGGYFITTSFRSKRGHQLERAYWYCEVTVSKAPPNDIGGERWSYSQMTAWYVSQGLWREWSYCPGYQWWSKQWGGGMQWQTGEEMPTATLLSSGTMDHQ